LPSPNLGRVGLIAAWEDEEALDSFLGSHPLAEQLADGWHARLEPLRAFGSWSSLPDFPSQERAVEPHEQVVVLTLGRLRMSRALAFLRASSLAEGQAVAEPALLASTGLARPGLVATLSVWRTAEAMRAYATGRSGRGHSAALQANSAHPFHRESIFMRFRPLASTGLWDGCDPLALQVSSAQGDPARRTPLGEPR
jgi:hypothetical protein